MSATEPAALDQAVQSHAVTIYPVAYPASPGATTGPDPQAGPEGARAGWPRLSGGRLFKLPNEAALPGVLDEIVADLRSQYVLGFTPDASGAPGRLRKISREGARPWEGRGAAPGGLPAGELGGNARPGIPPVPHTVPFSQRRASSGERPRTALTRAGRLGPRSRRLVGGPHCVPSVTAAGRGSGGAREAWASPRGGWTWPSVVFDVRERAYRIYRERDDQPWARRGWRSGSPGTRAAFRGEAGCRQRLAAAGASAPGGSSGVSRSTPGSPLRSGVFALLDDGDPEAAEPFAVRGRTHRTGARARWTTRWSAGRCTASRARDRRQRLRTVCRSWTRSTRAVLAGEMTRPRADRARRLLSDRAPASASATTSARCSGAIASRNVCREVGAAAAVRGVPHAIRVGLHVARRLGRGRTRADRRQPTSLAACRPAHDGGEGLVRLGRAAPASGHGSTRPCVALRAQRMPIRSPRWDAPASLFDRGDVATPRRISPSATSAGCPANNRTERAAALELLVRARLEQGSHADGREARAVAELARDRERRTGPDRCARSRPPQPARTAGWRRDRARSDTPPGSVWRTPSTCSGRAPRPFETGRARLRASRVAMDALGRPALPPSRRPGAPSRT